MTLSSSAMTAAAGPVLSSDTPSLLPRIAVLGSSTALACYWLNNYERGECRLLSDDAATTVGDPITRFAGRETRYVLPTDRLEPVFRHPPFAVHQRAGPAHEKATDLTRRGDWVVEMTFEAQSEKTGG